jgi:histone H3/H4
LVRDLTAQLRVAADVLAEQSRVLKRRRDAAEADAEVAFEDHARHSEYAGPAIEPGAFRRLASELLQDRRSATGFSADALVALQSAAEEHLVGMLAAANRAAAHARRDFVAPEDVAFAAREQDWRFL